jgi:hypothetical protein
MSVRIETGKRNRRCSGVAAGILPAVEGGILPPGLVVRIYEIGGLFLCVLIDVRVLPPGGDAPALRQAGRLPLQLQHKKRAAPKSGSLKT